MKKILNMLKLEDISEEQIALDIKANSFRIGWPGAFATFCLFFLADFNFSSKVLYLGIFIFQIISVAAIDLLSDKFRYHHFFKPKEYIRINYFFRIMIYLLISIQLGIYFDRFGYYNSGGLWAIAILAASYEAINVHSFYYPRIGILLMAIISFFPIGIFSLTVGKYVFLQTSFYCVYTIIQYPKLVYRYQQFKEKIDLKNKLMEEKEILSNIIDSMPMGFSWFDNQLNYIKTNQFNANLVGIKREEFVGKKFGFSQALHQTNFNLKSFLHSDKTEYSLVIAFKNLINNSVSRYRTHWKKLSNQGVILMAFDIENEIKIAEENYSLVKRMNLLTSASSMATWSIDLVDYRYIYHDNPDVLGFRLEQRASIDQFYNKIDPKFSFEFHSERMSVESGSTDSTTFEFRFDHPKKGWIWIKCFMMVYERNINNEPVSIIGFHQDITDQKESEAMIMQSSKLASLGIMAAGIAHEINNPLTVINSKSQILRKQMNAGEAIDPVNLNHSLETIEKSVKRIVKIINGLKYFSRDASQDPMEKVNLKDIVEDTLAFAQTRIKATDVSLTVDEVDVHLSLLCRPVQISQVLLNLLNNAFDAITLLDEKWIKLAISSDEKFIFIKVIDSGKGIPEEVQSKLLTPFFTTKETGKGTGLGLSISSGIVHNHGGEFFIDNESPNTCFVIKLLKSIG
jgi:signal transduction histidine kinase